MTPAESSRILFLLDALKVARGRTRRALLRLAKDEKANHDYQRAIDRLRKAKDLPTVSKEIRTELW